MTDSKYKWILYTIVVVILCTIGIQAYWNYKNYLTNKQQFINDVQVSLDNAVDTYYGNLAKKNTLGFSFERGLEGSFFEDNEFQKIIDKMDLEKDGFSKIDSVTPEKIKGITIFKGKLADSLLTEMHSNETIKKQNYNTQRVLKITDTLRTNDLKELTTKMVISITTDSLKLDEINSLFLSELQRKNLNLDYGLSFNNKKNLLQTFNKNLIEPNALITSTKSTFLPDNSELRVYFKNETGVILKRIYAGIIISILLIFGVIAILFTLLKIIKNQKQLAVVKNDLISNITHEFKTPISTISVALESIRNFNAIDNKEKTMKYLNVSSNQLLKLNVMVEKLLETATLDSENLELNKENINVVDLINQLVDKHNMQKDGEKIQFLYASETLFANVDPFHFENAINNILDNAIKYGGEEILVKLNQNEFSFIISISDNGTSLNKNQKDKIFEKFYRVHQGNTHDVKGFGIGLYYTKKIIEKHGGNIQLLLNNSFTNFKITLPNA